MNIVWTGVMLVGLGLLVVNMINNYNNKSILISIIICIIYATSDEIHQLFVPGRSCQLLDILIDTIGSVIGIYLYKKILIRDTRK